jgi:chromate transporter
MTSDQAATNAHPGSPEPLSLPGYSLWQLVMYALKLGTLGFGGPVALVGYMHRDLVEARRWISEADYKEGLTLAQLMPGPLAAQLAMYLGYVHYRNLGATLVGIAFVVPSFVMVVLIGMAYVAYGGLTWRRYSMASEPALLASSRSVPTS